MTAIKKPALRKHPPMLMAMIEDMLHGDGIPRCKEWDRLEAFAAKMERDRMALVVALRRVTDVYMGDKAISSDAPLYALKAAALLREIGEGV